MDNTTTFGFHIKNKRYNSMEDRSGGVDPRFEESLYKNKNKVKIIRDILANQRHRQVLQKFVLLAKDPALKDVPRATSGSQLLELSPKRASRMPATKLSSRNNK